MILCKAKYAKDVDRVVMPGMQGGPLMHVIAAKAVALKEALEPEFKTYQAQVVKNARALAEELKRLGYHLVSGGTDTHLLLVNLTTKGMTGKQAEDTLGLAGITVNKNTVPFETQKPMVTSGIRLGTPALTTRGMKEDEMVAIAGLIDKVLTHPGEEAVASAVKGEVGSLCKQFPLYAHRIS
jgi:glycine hydroxymethyltransferase